MFKWIEKLWAEWFSLDDLELLDDAYMQVNKLHPEEEDEC